MKAIFVKEPLYPDVKTLPWEEDLFNTRYLRRLKYLAHFGAGSFVSPVVHSRFEHTIGVWKLASIFFPDNHLVRASAILHDIGHLPFSHAVEKTLGFDHHLLTEEYIKDIKIERILNKIGLTSKEVIDFLNTENQITGTTNIIGLDHLDSFLRDTYMNGNIDHLPAKVLKNIKCSAEGVETDFNTGMYLLKLIYEDHKLFLSPELLAADRILAEAVKIFFNEVNNCNIEFLTDNQLLNLLLNSNNQQVKSILSTLLYNPSNITINTEVSGKGIQFGVRKIYNKIPLCGNEPLSNNEAAQFILSKIQDLKKIYELVLPVEENLKMIEK
ncbi:HD domain-containing protein [Terribacillus sp. 7520-G]|uniref:HD domain-containing protein n=1 Tax=Terribacillus sp. 7520-G TaxID=2025389 RepID=UPI000BA5A186|nr:HD domain-containing protein [Terribacillus sp. 7520-G]PAD39542.1 hypothetical protein CHH53_04840 [Terribacillus sp. 7520-G]